jgi:hypothetical protein
MGVVTYGLNFQPVAVVTETAATVVTDDVLVGGFAGAFGGAVAAVVGRCCVSALDAVVLGVKGMAVWVAEGRGK